MPLWNLSIKLYCHGPSFQHPGSTNTIPINYMARNKDLSLNNKFLEITLFDRITTTLDMEKLSHITYVHISAQRCFLRKTAPKGVLLKRWNNR